jgi:hypothetical protein
MDMNEFDQSIALSVRIALFGTIAVVSFCIAPGCLATISRNVDAEAAITAMWSIVRPVDSLRNWFAALCCVAPWRVG